MVKFTKRKKSKSQLKHEKRELTNIIRQVKAYGKVDFEETDLTTFINDDTPEEY